jgi:hypothetical protein
MTSPSPSGGPSRGSTVLILLTAALVGFLGGALAAVTTGTDQDLALPGSSPAVTSPVAPTPSPTTGSTAAPATLTLAADRGRAKTDELIRLEGRLEPASGGVRLQVQQSVDGADFVDFPVTAQTRSDGSYGVWVRTGRVGSNQFRMVTQVQGRSVVSPPVLVQIS